MSRPGAAGRRAAAALVAALCAAAWTAPARAGDDDLARRVATLRALSERPAAAATASRAGGYPVPERTARAVRDAALRYRLDPRLLRAVIRHESNWDPGAVSPAGAVGLMQLMPATARELGVVRPGDPRENVMGGARYLRRLFDRFGAWPVALAAYHAGPRNARDGTLGPATRRYVARVLATWGRPSP